jgi:transcriptional regulator with XRE-family HTH domain
MKNVTIPIWTTLDRLIKARNVAGFTQAKMAEELGVSLATVRRIESGEKAASRMEIYGWGVTCGVDPEWIMEGGEASVIDAVTLQNQLVFAGLTTYPEVETVCAA